MYLWAGPGFRDFVYFVLMLYIVLQHTMHSSSIIIDGVIRKVSSISAVLKDKNNFM